MCRVCVGEWVGGVCVDGHVCVLVFDLGATRASMMLMFLGFTIYIESWGMVVYRSHQLSESVTFTDNQVLDIILVAVNLLVWGASFSCSMFYWATRKDGW